MPKGQKVCDHCGHVTGPRSYFCPQCRARFEIKTKKREYNSDSVILTMTPMNAITTQMPKKNKPHTKMGRGKKQCDCGAVVGARTQQCPACEKYFMVRKGITNKKRKLKGIKIHWQELKPGDIIRVKGGPVWIGENSTENLGYFGFFRVKRLTNDGIGAYSIDKKEAGYCYIYMGPPKPSKSGSLLKPHRIRKIDPQYLPRKLREKIL